MLREVQRNEFCIRMTKNKVDKHRTPVVQWSAGDILYSHTMHGRTYANDKTLVEILPAIPHGPMHLTFTYYHS